MLDSLTAQIASRVRLLALLIAAALIGAVAAAAAATPPRALIVGDSAASTASASATTGQVPARAGTAEDGDDVEDADDAGEPQGVHGRCVQAVASDPSAVGGRNHNHGGAVSAAAHSCPRGHGVGGPKAQAQPRAGRH